MAKTRNDNAVSKRYFILGAEASIFWDPTSQLKVLSRDAKSPDVHEGTVNSRIALAIKAGHIIEVDEPEPAGEEVKSSSKPAATSKPSKPSTSKSKKLGITEDEDEEDDEDEDEDNEDDEKGLDDLTKEELLAKTDVELLKLYKKEFEVTTKDEKAFKAKSHEEKVAFLKEEQ